jgi:KipI family sensor histidine kinase inhibitor
LAEYGGGIDLAVNRKVRALAMLMEEAPPPGIVEIVPTYRSLLIEYDPAETNPAALKQRLFALEARLESVSIPPPQTVEIPVCYGGDFGPDIDFVAGTHGLTESEVIRLHTAPEYPIYMIGFTPGFPFLGGLDERLATPRLETPRTRVPEGSVGIANAQTGIYPVASPGGWRIIGRTPLKLFSPEKENPFCYKPGDRLKFRAVTPDGFARLQKHGEES